jgi:hypothetical protein
MICLKDPVSHKAAGVCCHIHYTPDWGEKQSTLVDNQACTGKESARVQEDAIGAARVALKAMGPYQLARALQNVSAEL